MTRKDGKLSEIVGNKIGRLSGLLSIRRRARNQQMKLLVLFAVMMVVSTSSMLAGTCAGKDDCKACVNCRSCRHCNPPRSPKDTRPKPSCGVCRVISVALR